MRERLKDFLKEDSELRLRRGLEEFHKDNEDALYLIAKDGTKFYTSFMNVMKLLRRERLDVEEVKHQLKEAIECLEDADKTIHRMDRHKYKVA